jgi:hypothetical protein
MGALSLSMSGESFFELSSMDLEAFLKLVEASLS